MSPVSGKQSFRIQNQYTYLKVKYFVVKRKMLLLNCIFYPSIIVGLPPFQAILTLACQKIFIVLIPIKTAQPEYYSVG